MTTKPTHHHSKLTLSPPVSLLQKSFKSFVGSASREPDYEVVETKETKGGSIPQSPPHDTKSELTLVPMGAIKAAHRMLANSGKCYTIRISSGAASVAFSSSVVSLLLPWSPLSNSEFTDLAVLFDQYKVKRHVAAVWFVNNASVSSPAALPEICLVGADPGSHISTASSTNVANLGEMRRWNPLHTRLNCASFVTPESTINRAPPPNPLTKDGFLPVTDAWGGQTVVYAFNSVTSLSNTALFYQQTWDVDLRCRV
jgi:hypothetical protein